LYIVFGTYILIYSNRPKWRKLIARRSGRNWRN